MSQVLEQLELTVGAFGQDRRAERLHNLLDSHGLVGELVLCRTVSIVSKRTRLEYRARIRTHHTSPKAPMPTGCKSVYLAQYQYTTSFLARIYCTAAATGGGPCVSAYLLVISNVVPKIWARTNSAILQVDAQMLGPGWSLCASRCAV